MNSPKQVSVSNLCKYLYFLFFWPIFYRFIKIKSKGYGQTEGLISCQQLDNSECNLGPVFDFVQMKIIDVPEMNYLTSKNQGQLLVKGESIFTGYYKDEKLTKESFDSDGYYYTGDVVEVMYEKKSRSDVESIQVLKFIDRVKNHFKTSQGEYISPNEVENLYAQSNVCSYYFLHGDALREFCIGIGFIEEANVDEMIEKYQIKSEGELTIAEKIELLKPKLVKK